jgi:hypothetical protein
LGSRFRRSVLAGFQNSFQCFRADRQIATFNRFEAHAGQVAEATGLFQHAGLGVVENGLPLVFDQGDNVAGRLKAKFDADGGMNGG